MDDSKGVKLVQLWYVEMVRCIPAVVCRDCEEANIALALGGFYLRSQSKFCVQPKRCNRPVQRA